MKKQLFLFSALTLASSLGFAQGVPHTFSSGQPARAAEVNENFQSVIDLIDANILGIANNTTALQANTATISDNTEDIVNNENTIIGLDTRIGLLEVDSGLVNATTVAVDCSSDTITNALNSAPALGSLVINVSGACTETVVITRSNTSLIGVGSASIAYDIPVTSDAIFGNLQNTISIIGAQNVVVDNLTISGATAVPSADSSVVSGVAILAGSAAHIKNSTISGSYDGVTVSAASARLTGNTIESNVRTGLLVANTGAADLLGGNSISQLTNATPDGRAYGIGIYRSSLVRTLGTNTITTANIPFLSALSVYYNSTFRSYYGLLTIDGNSNLGDHSQVEFRDINYTGNISVNTFGILRLTNRVGQTESGITFTGNINAGLYSLVSSTTGTTIDGNIGCTGGSAFISGTVTGVTTGC